MTGDSASVDIRLERVPVPTAIRITLTWGMEPFDLDLHLSGPRGGGRFHAFFDDLMPVPFVALSPDDLGSFGPEVLSVNLAMGGPLIAGDYRCWVHNFSHSFNNLPATFAASPATVVVLAIDAAGLPTQLGTYDVANATGPQADDIWHVVDLTIGSSGTVMVRTVQTLQPGQATDVL
jgi:hypothetical protein